MSKERQGEVTPAMLEAGARELHELRLILDYEKVAERVFRRMRAIEGPPAPGLQTHYGPQYPAIRSGETVVLGVGCSGTDMKTARSGFRSGRTT